EIRNHIYSFLLPESPIWISHYGPGVRRFNQPSAEEPLVFSTCTQICRRLRYEFYSLHLKSVKIAVDLASIAMFAQHYDRAFSRSEACIRVVCDVSYTPRSIDILPLLSLAVDAPRLLYSDRKNLICLDTLCEIEAQDMGRLIARCRSNTSWQAYVRDAIKAVILHSPRNRCDHSDSEEEEIRLPRDAWIQTNFAKEHKQLWMDGMHSFDELEEPIDETGLDGLKSMDVRVSLTTMKTRGRSICDLRYI
ncbi:hypothetical protein CC86DRAFT_425310, partial [Ophiobolus disseminans]